MLSGVNFMVHRATPREAPDAQAIPVCGKDNAVTAACWLYYATLDLLVRSENPARDRHRLVEPLQRLLGESHSPTGQAECAQIAAALASQDPSVALDVCRDSLRRASSTPFIPVTEPTVTLPRRFRQPKG